MRSPAGSGSVGWRNSVSTWKMTAPTQIANAIARPPTMVRPGYFTSIRPPSLRSSESPSNQARPAPVAERLFVPLHAAEGDQRPPTRLDGIQSLLAHQALRLHLEVEARSPSSCATRRRGGRTAGAGARGIPRASSLICSAHGSGARQGIGDARAVCKIAVLITLRNCRRVCSCRCRGKSQALHFFTVARSAQVPWTCKVTWPKL